MEQHVHNKYQYWLQEWYYTQTLLPPPSIKRSIHDEPQDESANMKYKSVNSKKQGAIRNWRRFLWNNAGKLFTILLATQVTVIEASRTNKTTSNEFMQKNISSNHFPLVDITEENIPTIANDTRWLVETNPDFEVNQYDNGSSLHQQSNHTTISKRVARSSSQCTVSKDILTGLKTELENALSSADAELVEESGCNSASNNSDCDEVIKLIQCLISRLSYKFVQASEKPTLNELEQLNITANDLFRQIENVRDKVNKEGLQKHRKQLDKLTEELQKDQSQFIKLTTDLQNLRKELGWLVETAPIHEVDQYSEKLSFRTISHFGRRPQCIVSEDRIIELKTELGIALANVSGVQDNSCNPNSNNLDCNELINLIQCEVSSLSSGFIQAEANRASLDEMKRLKSIVANLYEQRANVIDEVKKNVLQKYQQQYDQFMINLQNLKTKLNSARDYLEKTADQLCIVQIARGHIEDAILQFKSLNDNSKLPVIIRSVYDGYGKLNQLDNILSFIKKLPSCSQDALAYPALFDILKSNNHFGEPKILVVFDAVKSCVKHLGSLNIQQLKTDLITTLSRNIIRENYTQIISYTKQSANAANAVKDYLPDIIKNVYAYNLNNFEKTLGFIHALPWLAHWYEGYNALFYTMKENSDLDTSQLVRLAYKVREAINKENKIIVVEELKDQFNNLKSLFSSGIRALLWDDWVAIESTFYTGYTLYGGQTGYMYICSDNYYEGGKNQKWIVKSMEENGNIYFRFVNQENARVFKATKQGNAYSYEEYPICPCAYWQVMPIKNGAYFYFKNKGNGRILAMSMANFYSCPGVHANEYYTGTRNQQWKIR